MHYDFNASTGYWLTLTSHHYQQRIDAELRPFGITFRQFQVLAWLKCDGRLTQSELARRMFIEPPTLAGIMARMESMQWIQRVSCSRDRRKKYLEFGEAAQPIWEQIVDVLNKVRVEATANFSPAEIEQFHSLLCRVLRNLGGTSIPPLPNEATAQRS